MRLHLLLAAVAVSMAGVSGQNAKVSPPTGLGTVAPVTKSPSSAKVTTTKTTPKPTPTLKRLDAMTPVPAKTLQRLDAMTPVPAKTLKRLDAMTPVPPTAELVLPDWVGPQKAEPTEKACYRKTHISRDKQCSLGYNFDGIKTCWTQCPLEYPVSCGFECLPQNKDCTKDILNKVASVATVALNAATSGVFGNLEKAAKGVQLGVKCGQQLFNVVTKLVAIIDDIEADGDLTSKRKAFSFALARSDIAITDLPAAVTTCLDLPELKGTDLAGKIATGVGKVLEELVNRFSSGEKVLQTANFINMTATAGVGASITQLDATGQAKLKQLVGNGVTCGGKVQDVIDRTVRSIEALKDKNPSASVEAVRFAVLNSQLILQELPDATMSCFASKATSTFETRDQIIKTVHVIIDKVIEASSVGDKPVAKASYKMEIAKMGLSAIALFDPTGLADMASTFLQPICGPTIFVGEIDDGPADQALGLTTMQKAFRGTTGQWRKKGDGKITLTFKSVDTKDVKVNILSGGKLAYQVPVKKGETVVWSKPLSEFQGKTLYLDRWRAGFVGMPGSGGGSVLAWVPLSTTGSLTLTVPINPTTFLAHARV